jgi:hypothetical protein
LCVHFKKILNLIFKAQEFQFKQKNLRSATTHEKALLEQINKEIDLGGIAGFFLQKNRYQIYVLTQLELSLKAMQAGD